MFWNKKKEKLTDIIDQMYNSRDKLVSFYLKNCPEAKELLKDYLEQQLETDKTFHKLSEFLPFVEKHHLQAKSEVRQIDTLFKMISLKEIPFIY